MLWLALPDPRLWKSRSTGALPLAGSTGPVASHWRSVSPSSEPTDDVHVLPSSSDHATRKLIPPSSSSAATRRPCGAPANGALATMSTSGVAAVWPLGSVAVRVHLS